MLDYKTRVLWLTQLNSDTVELAVELVEPKSINFLAGQFMQYKIGSFIRPFSIASAPQNQNQQLNFCIQLLEQGVASDFVRSLKLGDEIIMDGPWGTFTCENLRSDVVFVATGVGIAPYISMIPNMLSTTFKHRATLLFGLTDEEQIYYFDFFSQLSQTHKNFEFIPMLSRPKKTWVGGSGRVTTFLDANYKQYSNYTFYICGGVEMVKDVRSLLLKKGQSLRNVRQEIFV